MSLWQRRASMALAAGLMMSPFANALTIGQIDTFSSGTTEGWFAGGGPFGQQPPVPPTTILSGGPGGATDAFLQVTSHGAGGAGSRLVVMNAAQWAGNYLAAGVGSIEMDLRNFGASDLAIRLLFEDPIPGPPQNIAISSDAITLQAGGGWVHVSFAVSIAALTSVMGDVGTLLTNTTLLRILHADDAVFPGEPIASVLGIDNISARAGALTVDEPTSAWLVAVALALAGAARRVRRAV